MTVKQRTEKLREKMAAAGIDVYVITASDFHGSEYVNPHFRELEFISGFTGSAGTFVSSPSGAVLFTDGRYYIQAENELAGSGIELMRSGSEGVPALSDYIISEVPEGGTLGFDGRTMTASDGFLFERELKKKNAGIIFSVDLAGQMWENRPEIRFSDIFILDEKYAGESAGSKLERVRAVMKEEKIARLVITSLDDIAWLLNIRANDIECSPLAMSFCVVTETDVTLYTDARVPDELECDDMRGKEGRDTGQQGKVRKKRADRLNLKIKAYSEIYSDINTDINADINSDTRPDTRPDTGRGAAFSGATAANFNRANFALIKELSKSGDVIDRFDVTSEMKCVKNDVEIENIKECHVRDGIAVTRFMMRLKDAAADSFKKPFTEMSAAACIDGLRRQIDDFIEPSFETISAYASNAAMMHYTANEKSNAVLKPEGFLLVDSGGHYLSGTTDITRTFALGRLTDEMKKHFTLVVKSMLTLANAKFLSGCTGRNLDVLAREPLWEHGMDYKCGTGHGVGYLLSVHEGPNSFRWRSLGKNDDCVLKPGMITTDEPGVYLEGKYGIRIENELLCVENEKNGDGQFLRFEPVTYAPIDLDAIDARFLENADIKRLNEYHSLVYEKLSPHLCGRERERLGELTRPISK